MICRRGIHHRSMRSSGLRFDREWIGRGRSSEAYADQFLSTSSSFSLKNAQPTNFVPQSQNSLSFGASKATRSGNEQNRRDDHGSCISRRPRHSRIVPGPFRPRACRICRAFGLSTDRQYRVRDDAALAQPGSSSRDWRSNQAKVIPNVTYVIHSFEHFGRGALAASPRTTTAGGRSHLI
jgi:hypothetical protein